MIITAAQAESLTYHSANVRRLEAAKDHIKMQRVRVNIRPEKPNEKEDPLGQGLFLDIEIPAETIRERINALLYMHNKALADMGVTIIPG